tara:strand:- start:139 stop:840 length:702 start_codon:yes stop_codon:yes gene_type:complete
MKFYDYPLEYSEQCFTPSTVSNLTAPRIPIQDKKVLDLGCGIGPLSVYFASEGAYSVTGTDVHKEHIKYANINAKNNDVEINFIQGDLFENITEKYDIICCDVSGIDRRVAELTDWFPKGVPTADETGVDLICRAIKEHKNYLNKGGEMYVCTSSFSDHKKLLEAIGDDGEVFFEKNIPFSKALTENVSNLDPSSYTKKGSRYTWTFTLWRLYDKVWEEKLRKMREDDPFIYD